MDSDENLKIKQEALKYGFESFDKNIIYIASSALAVSFAFIDKIVPLKVAINKYLLFNAWYIFAIVIFINLASHYVSILMISWAIKNHNLDQDQYNKGHGTRNIIIRIINLTCIVGILAGMICLFIFIEKNI